MSTYARALLALMLGVALLPARAQDDQPTLAEQAARARATQSSDVDTRIAGKLVDGVYRNEFLGFEVRALPQWDAMNRGQMNVNDAIGREILHLKAGINTTSTGRVFGMHDGRGQSVIVDMRLALSDVAVQDIPKEIEKEFHQAFPGAQVTRETAALLGDSSHHFDGVRVQYTLAGHDIVQSLQYIVWKNYLITFTSTSGTHEQLTALLKQLRTHVTWIGAAGSPTPTTSAAPARTPPPSTPTK